MNKAVIWVLALIAALAGLVAAALYWQHTIIYERTALGTLKGRLQVEWVDQDTFVFTPDPANPLVFMRANKDSIQPGMMRTDFGSVPVALRAVKSYSPWGYAPAFLMHDWLFVMKHCKLPGFEKLSLDEAATIMAEVLKTMMESKRYGDPNKLVHYSMYEAVRTSTAREYWDKGTCTPSQTAANKLDIDMKRTRSASPATAGAAPPTTPEAKLRYTLEFK